jgi:hypothetical protein
VHDTAAWHHLNALDFGRHSNTAKHQNQIKAEGSAALGLIQVATMVQPCLSWRASACCRPSWQRLA